MSSRRSWRKEKKTKSNKPTKPKPTPPRPPRKRTRTTPNVPAGMFYPHPILFFFLLVVPLFRFARQRNNNTDPFLFWPCRVHPRSSCRCRCRLRFLPTVLHLVPPNLCNCLRCVRQRDSSIVGVLNERKKEINHNRKDVILNRRVQMQKIAFTMYNGLL